LRIDLLSLNHRLTELEFQPRYKVVFTARKRTLAPDVRSWVRTYIWREPGNYRGGFRRTWVCL